MDYIPMQNGLKAHGNFPDGPIFKAFSKIEYAEAFVEQGQFRMGSLNTYRNIEGERKDELEGNGHIRIPGQVISVCFDANDPDSNYVREAPGLRNIHSELGNPIYIFSTSLPEVDLCYLKQRFGQFIVQIYDPRQLAHDITEHLKLRPEKFAGGIEGAFVSYNRGGIVDTELNDIERTTLSYSQKSAEFIDEREFRFIAINMDRPSAQMTSKYMEIDLGGPINYAKIIDVSACNE